MSLFGDDAYQWRETYFVMLRAPDRPKLDQVLACLQQGQEQYQVSHAKGDSHGRFEFVTVVSPDDFSGMDIAFVTGDEVTEQIEELTREIARSTLTEEDQKKLARLQQCDARLDIFHFENMAGVQDLDEEYLDPGSLIIVLRRLARLCHGIGIDPQSGSLM